MKFELRAVSVHYQSMPVLQNISCTIEQGSMTLLDGQTGAGKTTFLRLLYRDILPDYGEVLLNGENFSLVKQKQLRGILQKMGVAFQDCRLLSDYTLYENVLYPLHIGGMSRQDANRECLKVLAGLDLSHLRDKFPAELSGGERHLAALARALVTKPELILADEPTGNLDSKATETVARVLREANEAGATVVLATHSRELMDYFPSAKRISLDEGKIREAQQAQAEVKAEAQHDPMQLSFEL